jgi:hypothetical protein
MIRTKRAAYAEDGGYVKTWQALDTGRKKCDQAIRMGYAATKTW